MKTPEEIAIEIVARRSGAMFYVRRSNNPQYRQDEIDEIAAALRSYGAAQATAQRERDAQAVEATVYPRSGEDYDEWRAAMLMRDYCAAAIRAL